MTSSRRWSPREGLDARVKVFQSGCLSHCESGPAVVTFPDGRVHVGVTAADLPALLDALAAAVAAGAGDDISAPG